jgi:hypothetical protein
VGVVQLLFQRLGAHRLRGLSIEILLLEVFVIEFLAHVFVIINPGSDHVGVLLVEVHVGWRSVKEDRLVVSDLVSGDGICSIDEMLSPQVRVRSALVHCRVRLEEFLNIEFVFLKHGVNLLLIVRVHDLVEVSSHSVLLFVKPVEVWSSYSEDVLSQKLPQCAPKQQCLKNELLSYL